MRISDWSSDVCSSDLDGHSKTRYADIEDRHRRRIDDPQPHPLARIEERGPIVARTVAIDEEAVGRAVDIGDVGRVHPHRAPRKTVLQRLILAGEQPGERSEEHTSELQSLMRISYAVLCL